MMALVTLDLYLNKLDEDFQSPHVRLREFQKFWLVPQYCPIVLPSCWYWLKVTMHNNIWPALESITNQIEMFNIKLLIVLSPNDWVSGRSLPIKYSFNTKITDWKRYHCCHHVLLLSQFLVGDLNSTSSMPTWCTVEQGSHNWVDGHPLFIPMMLWPTCRHAQISTSWVMLDECLEFNCLWYSKQLLWWCLG